MLSTNHRVAAVSPVAAPVSRPFFSPSGFAPSLQCAAVRTGSFADLDALESLERRAFACNRLARRSFARFLASPQASLIVADSDVPCAGYALVLFRAHNQIARVYSIAVDRANAKRGIATTLLRAVEEVAADRGSSAIRLEVRENNWPAINLYCKLGYRVFGHHSCYYDDGSHALRLSKKLSDVEPNQQSERMLRH